MTGRWHTIALSALVGVVLLGAAAISGTRRDRPIRHPKFDPTAEKIGLFEGLEKGTLDAVMIPKNALGGNVLVSNKTDRPLTVQMPPAFVGVQVVKQFGIGGYGGGYGGGLGGLGGYGGGAQAVGGGTASETGGGLGAEGGGAAFSIPPAKVVIRPYKSVCLEHGKKEPSPRMRYRLVQPDQFTQDPVLQELLTLVPRLDPGVAQAAAWNLANKMSWQELAAKKVEHVGGLPPTPYFTPAQLFKAQELVALLQARVSERQSKPSDDSASKPTGPRRGPARGGPRR